MKEEKASDKKKKNIGVTTIILRFLMVLIFLVFVGIRVASLLPGWGNIVDTYGYYSAAVIAQEQMLDRLSSGISFAYTQSLVDLLTFAGHAKWVVAVYHILLQLLSLVLMIAGCDLLFGKTAAYISGVVVMFSPWMLRSIFLVSPENYYLFFFTIGLLLIGVFFRKGRKSGWCRNNTGEGFLLFLGFFMGVLCIWHYFNFVLVILMLYAMIKNASYVRERIRTQQNLLEMEMLSGTEEAAKQEKNEAMPHSSQLFIVFAGMFLGAYCTLMKYTGVTGSFIKDQFIWWIMRPVLPDSYGRFQDIALWLPLQILLILLVGVISAAKQKVKETAEEAEIAWQEANTDESKTANEAEDIGFEAEVIESDLKNATVALQDTDLENGWEDDWRFDIDLSEDNDWRFDTDAAEEKDTWAELEVKNERKPDTEAETKTEAEIEFVTEKEVQLLDNPLPLPKKHVKKVMDFEEFTEKDDFDFSFHADDDFDV